MVLVVLFFLNAIMAKMVGLQIAEMFPALFFSFFVKPARELLDSFPSGHLLHAFRRAPREKPLLSYHVHVIHDMAKNLLFCVPVEKADFVSALCLLYRIDRLKCFRNMLLYKYNLCKYVCA